MEFSSAHELLITNLLVTLISLTYLFAYLFARIRLAKLQIDCNTVRKSLDVEARCREHSYSAGAFHSQL